MSPELLAMAGNSLDVIVKIGWILGPILIGFMFHRKNAMQSLIDSIPQIYDTIQAKRAQEKLAPLPSVIGEMLKLAAQMAGRALTVAEEARVTTELTAHDARLNAQGHTTTPLVPTLGGIPVSPPSSAPESTVVATRLPRQGPTP